MTNKLQFFITGLFALIFFTSNAQEFKFGLQAGIGLSDIRTSNNSDLGTFPDNHERKLSFNFNTYLGFKSKTFLGISTEPGFIRKGIRYPGNRTFGFAAYDVHLDYIHLPILLDFYIGKNFAISIGPEFAYMIDAKAKSSTSSNSVKSQYSEFETSGLIGVQFSISEHLDTGFRYSHGLSSVSSISFTDDNGQPLGELHRYNQYFSIFFRYSI